MNRTAAITGHTDGIGKGIHYRLENEGWNVLGFSRSNGYDISNSETVKRIIQESSEVDVFINNAEHKFSQVDLLYKLFDLWKNDDEKIILNLGSISGTGVKDFIHPYAVYKNALDEACKQLQNTEHKCRVINLRPGMVETSKIAHLKMAQNQNKLSVEDTTEMIWWLVNQPRHVYVNDITVQPRKYIE